jgi:dihydroorotate dehydrogenase
VGKIANKRYPALHQEILGLPFASPIGLAAGLDKNAEAIESWGALGFGFAEVGSVTPLAQAGNDKPRLFRIPKERSIQNAMGFNNEGMDIMHERIKERFPLHYPLGVNLGKNKATPMEKALDDYFTLIPRMEEVCDYFVINLSSPNTPGLRELENPKSIKALFSRATQETDKPIFLKISPDNQIYYTVEQCATAVDAGASGIIATNTSIDYSLSNKAKDFGGLSGALIKEKSFSVFDAIAAELYGKTILISVGGIDSAAEAYRRIKAGAALVQVYSALIYEGPLFIRRLNKELAELVEMSGLTSIKEAIGLSRNEVNL